MTEYVKKSDVLELLSLPKDLIAEYVCDLKGLWIDDGEAEPQTDCDGCQHYADKHTADACYECKRSYTDGYVPQTDYPCK